MVRTLATIVAKIKARVNTDMKSSNIIDISMERSYVLQYGNLNIDLPWSANITLASSVSVLY